MFLVVVPLALVLAAIAVITWSSSTTPILAGLIILCGLGLFLVEWAARI